MEGIRKVNLASGERSYLLMAGKRSEKDNNYLSMLEIGCGTGALSFIWQYVSQIGES